MMATAVASSFEDHKRISLVSLDKLLETGLPGPQQGLLVKQARQLVHRLAADREIGPIEGLVNFVQSSFESLDNRQLTVLNNILRSAMEKNPFNNTKTVMDIAIRAKRDLGIDLMQFQGFYTPDKQQLLSRIARARDLFCDEPSWSYDWLVDGDEEELGLAADVMELAGQTFARVSEENQIMVKRTYRGASICDGLRGETKEARMADLTKMKAIVENPETSAIAARWALLLFHNEPTVTLQRTYPQLRTWLLFKAPRAAFDPVRYHRLADMLEAMVDCPLTEGVVGNAAECIQLASRSDSAEWEIPHGHVMDFCQEYAHPTKPAPVPERHHSFAKLSVLDELESSTRRPITGEVHPAFDRYAEYMKIVVGEIVMNASSDDELARVRRLLAHEHAYEGRYEHNVSDQFLKLVHAFALKGHRILATNADAVRALFPTLSEEAIGHIRVIVASMMAMNLPSSEHYPVNVFMPEAQLAEARAAIQGLAQAYREFHQSGDTHYIDFTPLALLKQGDCVAKINAWLAENAGARVFRRNALRGRMSTMRAIVNEWNSGVSDASIIVEDFLISPHYQTVRSRQYQPHWVYEGLNLPHIIFNCNQAGPEMHKAHLAVVDMWKKMVETLYYHPRETISAGDHTSLNALYFRMTCLFSRRDATEEDYADILGQMAAVLRRINGEPETTTTELPTTTSELIDLETTTETSLETVNVA